MILTEYVNSADVNDTIKKYLKDDKNFSDERKASEIKNMITSAYNYGVFSLLTDRKVSKDRTKLDKTKEITAYLPDMFTNSDMGEQLTTSVMQSIKTNSSNYILNIGYETIIPDDIKKVLQIAYAIGITAGFDISSDPELKSIYQANIERFIKHGAGNNV